MHEFLCQLHSQTKCSVSDERSFEKTQMSKRYLSMVFMPSSLPFCNKFSIISVWLDKLILRLISGVQVAQLSER